MYVCSWPYHSQPTQCIIILSDETRNVLSTSWDTFYEAVLISFCFVINSKYPFQEDLHQVEYQLKFSSICVLLHPKKIVRLYALVGEETKVIVIASWRSASLIESSCRTTMWFKTLCLDMRCKSPPPLRTCLGSDGVGIGYRCGRPWLKPEWSADRRSINQRWKPSQKFHGESIGALHLLPSYRTPSLG